MVSQLTEAMIVNGVVLATITMIIVRTAGLAVRAARLPEAAAAPQPQPVAA
jgi:hypothetical protein